MSPVLEFQNIHRSYAKGKPVLNGVTFSVGEGEVVGLLGRNGAGKTTLIHIAMGTAIPARRRGARLRPFPHEEPRGSEAPHWLRGGRPTALR